MLVCCHPTVPRKWSRPKQFFNLYFTKIPKQTLFSHFVTGFCAKFLLATKEKNKLPPSNLLIVVMVIFIFLAVLVVKVWGERKSERKKERKRERKRERGK